MNHRRSYSSAAPRFPYASSYIARCPKFSSMSSPVSPVSPTYTTFSAASPVSSSSSASLLHEGSPVPEHSFDTITGPMDNVYSPSSSGQFYNTQGEASMPYSGGYEYNAMNWSLEGKKQSHIASQSLPTTTSMNRLKPSIYIPQNVPPMRQNQNHQLHHPSPTTIIHSPVPGHPLQPLTQQQEHHIARQTHIPAANSNNDILFDVDLDEWHMPNGAGMQAQYSPTNPHSQSQSMALAQLYTQYPSAPSSSRQEGLNVYTSPDGYSPAVQSQSQAYSSAHSQPTHIFNLSAPTVPPHVSIARPMQMQRTGSLSYFSSSPLSQQIKQQPFDTAYPADISPSASCGSTSPLSPYVDMGQGVSYSNGCEPRFVYSSEEDTDLKVALSLNAGMQLQDWGGDRRGSLASVASSFATTDGEREGDGDIDAEGEPDEGWGAQHSPPQELHGMSIMQVSDHQMPMDSCDEGEEEVPVKEESESDFRSGESEDDAEDDGSGEFVIRSRNRRAVESANSASFYGTEGRSLRPRSSQRYSPYSTYPMSTNGYAAEHYASESQSEAHPRRYTSSMSPPRSLGGNNDSSFNSSMMARRRNRPITCLPMPIPIPNLTKKSRGRHVPTASSLEDLRNASSGAGKKKRKEGENTRPHECVVEGCGKVFARGEHLKRHVRSLHTNEKPFKCKYPGCGKRFSRHDNLGQHTRVHKDYIPPEDATLPDSDSD